MAAGGSLPQRFLLKGGRSFTGTRSPECRGEAHLTLMCPWTVRCVHQVLTRPSSGPGTGLTLGEPSRATATEGGPPQPQFSALQWNFHFFCSWLLSGTAPGAGRGRARQGCPKLFLHTCLCLNPRFPQTFPGLDSYSRLGSRSPPQRLSTSSVAKLCLTPLSGAPCLVFLYS